mmetsp:Transcript_24058/g.59787  ORF Transcript_24058/g.59787 Transcript_24058/m.59787 type:complete len:223 (-) Transcript_24058:112-780(-)
MELIYLPVRARGETLRFMLHHSGIPFTDSVVSDLAAAKPSAPMRRFPTLVVGSGEVLFESGAIARFIGVQTGLYPVNEDAVKAAMTDAVFEVAQALMGLNPVVNVFSGARFEAEKAAMFEKFEKELPLLENILGQKNFFADDAKPLMGDFHVFHLLDLVTTLEPEYLSKNHSGLHSFYRRMPGASEGLRAYLAVRPRVGDTGTGESFIRNHAKENSYDNYNL